MREAIFLLTLPILSASLLFFVNGFLMHLWTPLILHSVALHGEAILPVIGVLAALLSAGSMIGFKIDMSPVKSLICCDSFMIVGLILLLVPTSEGYFPIQLLSRSNIFSIDNSLVMTGTYWNYYSGLLVCGASIGMNYRYTCKYIFLMCANRELEKRYIFVGWAMFYFGALCSFLSSKTYSPPDPIPE